jgi:predicted branched-subunit amino acid permease
LLRDAAAIAAAMVAVGASFGAIAIAYGLPAWVPFLMSTAVFAGGAQFLAVAFTLAEDDPVRRRRTYWLIGGTLFTSWNAGTALGVWLGGATGDPAALGLDAAFPAGLIALIMPSLRDRSTRLVALCGAAVAVLLTPVLPAGLPVLAALLGLAALVLPSRPARQAADSTPEVASC